MLKRKCHDKGNMAADDGYAFPVISNEIVLNGWNIVFWKSQVVCIQRVWDCSPGTRELELHQRGDESSLLQGFVERSNYFENTESN